MGIINSEIRNSSYVKKERANKFLMIVFSFFSFRGAIGEALNHEDHLAKGKGSLELKYFKVLFK